MQRLWKKFPFWIHLVSALLLLLAGLAIFSIERSKITAPRLTEAVQKDLNQRVQTAQKDLKGLSFESIQMSKAALEHHAIYSLFLLQNNHLVYWNNNLPGDTTDVLDLADSLKDWGVFQLGQGVYVAKKIPLTGTSTLQKGLLLFPLAYSEIFQGTRLTSLYFVGSSKIPLGTTIIPPNGQNVVTIDTSQMPLFSIAFDGAPESHFAPSMTTIWLLVSFVLLFTLWMHRFGVYAGEKTKPIFGWLFILGFALCLNLLRIFIGYPIEFENLEIFSASLFAGHGTIHSLFDLIFIVYLTEWLSFYFVRYLSINQLLRIRNKYLSVFVRLSLVFLLLAFLFGGVAYNVRALVLDSKIPFAIEGLSNVNGYSFIGLGLLVFITLIYFYILKVINDLLSPIFPPIWVRFVIITGLVGLIFIWFYDVYTVWYVLIQLVFSLLAILLTQKIGLPSLGNPETNYLTGLPRAYSGLLFVGLWMTTVIFYLNFQRERSLRLTFAETNTFAQKEMIYQEANNLSQELEKDPILLNYLKRDTANDSRIINYLDTKLQNNPYLNVYHAKFDFLRTDSTTNSKSQRKPSLANQSKTLVKTTTDSAVKSWVQFEPKKHQLILFIPIEKDGDFEGTARIVLDPFYKISGDLSMRSARRQNFLNPFDQQYFNDYSLALYQNQKLVEEVGAFGFPKIRKNQFGLNGSSGVYSFKERLEYSELFFKGDKGQYLVVYYKRNLAFQAISMFTYSVLSWLLVITFFFLSGKLVSGIQQKNKRFIVFNPTIRGKVVWTIMTVVFLSLVVTGSITSIFLKDNLRTGREKDLFNMINALELNNLEIWDTGLTNLKSQKEGESLQTLMPLPFSGRNIMFNIYSKKGRLLVSYNNEFNDPLFSPQLLSPIIFEELDSSGEWGKTIEEKLGSLSLDNLYIPLTNQRNEIIGVLSAPDYSSNPYLKDRILSILNTLFIIYMLLFFIGGMLSILISNSIVRSIYLLIDRFRGIKLKHNTMIHWPYHDELGLLANEYNHLIVKVERMAVQLAGQEREDAWREIALQVAHEIKNPLTPMKLNVQYVKKAIKEGRPDILALTQKVCDSMLEQINNLTIIASEFADFARTPQPQPERLDVVKQLDLITQLYHKKQAEIISDYPDVHPMVYMDKSYFTRIFNNLIKNGIQAVPSEVEPIIHIFVGINDQNNAVSIVVEDNGTGIDENMMEHIFVPHFTTKTSGSGIGLAVSKTMIETSGGSVHFETEVNKGTRFIVLLPLANK